MTLLLFFTAFFTACVPALVWLFIFQKEDRHPEPKRMLVFAFSAGVFVSAIVFIIQYAVQNAISSKQENYFVFLLLFAFAEELFKFLAAYKTVRKDEAFDEPVDAMIYMIAAALGFATVENIFVVTNSIMAGGLNPIMSLTETALIRFVGATLLHTLASGMAGYYWAKGIMKKREATYAVFGIILASVVHAFFNRLIIYFQNADMLIYPSAFLVVILFIVLWNFEKLKTIRVSAGK